MKIRVKGTLNPGPRTWVGETAVVLPPIEVDLELEFVAEVGDSIALPSPHGPLELPIDFELTDELPETGEDI